MTTTKEGYQAGKAAAAKVLLQVKARMSSDTLPLRRGRVDFPYPRAGGFFRRPDKAYLKHFHEGLRHQLFYLLREMLPEKDFTLCIEPTEVDDAYGQDTGKGFTVLVA